MISNDWMIRVAVGLCLAAAVLGGCGGSDKAVDRSLWSQISEIDKEKTDLRMQAEALQKENQQLKARLETLSQIEPQKRIDALPGAQKIELGRRTGLFDKDGDGVKEMLAVYVRPLDAANDVIKAAGDVQVQLWDLNSPGGEALLGDWTIGASELKDLWASTFMTYYYRLGFDVRELIRGRDHELTVKVAFTDYVTGRVFREQMVIEKP